MSSIQWLGLCALTESNEPHEWWPVMWAIRNRVESKRYPNTFGAVVMQPSQFSAFNDWQGVGEDDMYELGLAHIRKHALADKLPYAEACAAHVIAAPMWQRPFSSRVLYYYSPVSMIPKRTQPKWWDAEVRREVLVSGVDPDRFVFGEARRP